MIRVSEKSNKQLGSHVTHILTDNVTDKAELGPGRRSSRFNRALSRARQRAQEKKPSLLKPMDIITKVERVVAVASHMSGSHRNLLLISPHVQSGPTTPDPDLTPRAQKPVTVVPLKGSPARRRARNAMRSRLTLRWQGERNATRSPPVRWHEEVPTAGWTV